jgi:hypothetical protein
VTRWLFSFRIAYHRDVVDKLLILIAGHTKLLALTFLERERYQPDFQQPVYAPQTGLSGLQTSAWPVLRCSRHIRSLDTRMVVIPTKAAILGLRSWSGRFWRRGLLLNSLQCCIKASPCWSTGSPNVCGGLD